MDKKKETKYVLISAVIVLLILAFLIVRPFFNAIITAAITALVFLPVKKFIEKRIKSKNVSTILTLFLIFLIVTLPIMFVLNILSKEAVNAYTLFQEQQSAGKLSIECEKNMFLCSTFVKVSTILGNEKIVQYEEEIFRKLSGFILSIASSFLVSIPAKILELFIIIFLLFYFLRDSDKIAGFIRDILPKKQSQNLIQKCSDVIFSVVYGAVLVAIVQGILGAIGFAIFGVPSPVLWGFVMIFFALIPLVGPAIIWLPAALWLIFTGIVTNNHLITFKGIGLLLYGIIIISSIDNILRPKIIGTRAKVHPAVILIGVIGGIGVFGLIGFIAGPLILALAIFFIGEVVRVKANEVRS